MEYISRYLGFKPALIWFYYGNPTVKLKWIGTVSNSAFNTNCSFGKRTIQ